MRSTRSPLVWPWWPAFVRCHQTKLYHKGSPKWVESQRAPVMRLPYLWPDEVFRISTAESKRSDWEIPSSWSWDPSTRIVVPR